MFVRIFSSLPEAEGSACRSGLLSCVIIVRRLQLLCGVLQRFAEARAHELLLLPCAVAVEACEKAAEWQSVLLLFTAMQTNQELCRTCLWSMFAAIPESCSAKVRKDAVCINSAISACERPACQHLHFSGAFWLVGLISCLCCRVRKAAKWQAALHLLNGMKAPSSGNVPLYTTAHEAGAANPRRIATNSRGSCCSNRCGLQRCDQCL